MPKPTFHNLPEEKKQLILTAAIDEFVEQGYNAASISKIVAAAGIAKGSFYQYFEDRADLFRHLLEIAGQEKARFLTDPPPSDLPPFDYLRWLLRGSVGFEARYPRLARLAAGAIDGGGPDELAFRAQIQQAAQDFYRRLLERGQVQGHIDPQLNLEIAALICAAASIRISSYVLEQVDIDPEALAQGSGQGPHAAEIEAIFDVFFHILEHGMGRKQTGR